MKKKEIYIDLEDDNKNIEIDEEEDEELEYMILDEIEEELD